MPRSIRKTVMAMAVILAFSACTDSADKAGGRGLQDVTVLEIAQPNDVAPAQVQAYAAEVEKQSHGSLRLHFNDVWRKGEVDFEKHTLEDVMSRPMLGAWVGVRSFDLIGVTSFQPLVAPLLVDSQLVQDRIFSEGIPLEMARGLQGHGLVAVAVLPGPMRKVLGVRKPFREPVDFRGTVLGIQGGEIQEATATALGATFTRMPSGAGLAGVDAYEQQVDEHLPQLLRTRGQVRHRERQPLAASHGGGPARGALPWAHRRPAGGPAQRRDDRDPGGARGDSDRGRLRSRQAVWTGRHVPARLRPAARRPTPRSSNRSTT